MFNWLCSSCSSGRQTQLLLEPQEYHLEALERLRRLPDWKAVRAWLAERQNKLVLRAVRSGDPVHIIEARVFLDLSNFFAEEAEREDD